MATHNAILKSWAYTYKTIISYQQLILKCNIWNQIYAMALKFYLLVRYAKKHT